MALVPIPRFYIFSLFVFEIILVFRFCSFPSFLAIWVVSVSFVFVIDWWYLYQFLFLF